MIITNKNNDTNLVILPKSDKELIQISKKGSKINIRKENKGKFTKYCKGKVTEECISKGKNSKDPKIRKRATFADNARKWSRKYLVGGNVLNTNFEDPYHDQEIVGTLLPEVVATPAKWHAELVEAFPYDLSKNIIETMQPFITEEEPESILMERLHRVWSLANKPKIYVNNDKGYRARYNPIFKSMTIRPHFDDFTAELSHPIQMKVGKNPTNVAEVFRGLEEIFGKYDRYDDPNHFEYETHEVIDPSIQGYILWGEKPDWMDQNGELIKSNSNAPSNNRLRFLIEKPSDARWLSDDDLTL